MDSVQSGLQAQIRSRLCQLQSYTFRIVQKATKMTIRQCFTAIMAIGVICLAFFIQNTCTFDSNKIPAEIHGYHFHTYFFQRNNKSTQEAVAFRGQIAELISSGYLRNCRLNRLNMGPVGPHPIGSFETCCNKTSLSQALTWFMENHGNLYILLHPLTRFEVLDHTTRAMFLGQELPLDISVLSEDLGDRVDRCLPLSAAIRED